MVKVSTYINKHLQILVKSNMDLQERQEEALDSKDKSKNIKEKNSKEKEKELKNRINNIILESNEKSQEDKINISNIKNEINNNNINSINKINENNNIDKKEEENNEIKSQKSITKNINELAIEQKKVEEEEKNPEDPLISYITSNRKISDEEIKNSSKLILEEIEGNLFNEKKIEINAGGMIGGRNKKDGFTIFGQNLEKNSNNDIFVPDFELNLSNSINNNNFSYPYIFSIYYKIEDKSYYIRSYSGKGSDNKILFIKLRNKNKYIIKQKEIISAGSIIFQINPINSNELEIVNLTNKKNVKIFDGNKQKLVTIGRHKECDFSFPKDKSFSRYQTCFEYDENKKEWSIIDGKDKDSTNGTWIFGTHSFLIKDEMIIEVLNSKIVIKEIQK